MDILVSNSNPVQFWLSGQQTFNQQCPYGRTLKRCFYQKFQNDDTIMTQAYASDSGVFQMGIFDQDGTQILAYTNFTALSGGYQYYSFKPFDIPAIGMMGRKRVRLSLAILGVEQATSDWIDIRPEQILAWLVRYSNPVNFDGLLYSGISQDFYIRIPGNFIEEDNPMTQEDLEDSRGEVWMLQQSIQEKRLFESDYMTNYMVLKWQKVLMHKDIEIDGFMWKRRDSFDGKPVKRFDLKKTNVLLTKQNSILKNTLGTGVRIHGDEFEHEFD